MLPRRPPKLRLAGLPISDRINKGSHREDAMRTQDDILRRLQWRQSKKRPPLRALKAWTLRREA